MTAWLLSLVWFIAALALLLGSAPFAYLAWALPAWLLFRRTSKQWAAASARGDAPASRWLPRAGAVLALSVLALTAWASAVPPEASATIYDTTFAAIYGLCLLYPLVFVIWVIARSKRLAAEATRPR